MLTKRLLAVSLLLSFLVIPGMAQTSYNYQNRLIEGRSASAIVGYDAMGVPIYRNQLGRSGGPMSAAPTENCTHRDKINDYC
jgi:hypothetical protein